MEWEVKKGSKRSFSKDVMRGSNPKVPQQNNFSDCGVYILQYVESFFEVSFQFIVFSEIVKYIFDFRVMNTETNSP